MANQVATVTEAPRRSVLIDMATRFGMEPAAFEQTLRATVVPGQCSREQFAAFLLVAKEYELNPLTKEIFAFPTRSGGIQPVVSVDGWCNLINSHPQLNGIEFDDHLTDDGRLTAITARIWRKDRDKPITVTEYMTECERDTEPWKKWPRRMLRHKALIQGARYAFGFAGIVDPDEAERMGADVSPMRDVSPRSVTPPPIPPAATSPKAPPHDPETGELWDEPATESPSVSPPPLPSSEAPVTEATAADVFDPAQWLKDLDAAFAGCEDMVSLGEEWARLALPHKDIAFPPDFDKATASFKKHQKRIAQTIIDAG